MPDMKPQVQFSPPAFLMGVLLAMPGLALAAQPLGCLIEPHQVVELGSPVIGVLDRVNVDRGSSIRKGQVLAILKADVERAAADVARSRAQAEADVQAAAANRDYTKQRLARSEELVKSKFISTQALDQAQTEYDVADKRLAQAREQKRIWDREHELARAQLSQRSLISPISGVVVERYLSPGERVEDKPVLKLASLNPLRVEVFMPASSFREVRPGMTARVTPDLPDAGERTAKVILVDRIVDPASNTFRVRLELPNPGNELPAGLRCKVAIGDQVVAAAAPTPQSAVVPSRLPPAPVAAPAVKPVVKPAAPLPAAKLPVPVPAVKPAMPAAAKAAVTVPTLPSSSDVLAAVESWRKAWQAKDMKAYLAAYLPDYRGDKPSREDWVKQREARILKPGPLAVGVADARVHALSERKVQVHFRQRYQSQGHAAEDAKTLMLVLENGKWLIQEERAGL